MNSSTSSCKPVKCRLIVAHGIRGYFASLVDHEGPVQSGFGSYATADQALEEVIHWALEEEDLDLVSPEDRQRAVALGYLSADAGVVPITRPSGGLKR